MGLVLPEVPLSLVSKVTVSFGFTWSLFCVYHPWVFLSSHKNTIQCVSAILSDRNVLQKQLQEWGTAQHDREGVAVGVALSVMAGTWGTTVLRGSRLGIRARLELEARRTFKGPVIMAYMSLN